MKWKTRITELLDIEYPIIEGGLSGVGTWELAAAVSNAGAHGTITAGVYRKPERLRKAIDNVRKITKKPFGVNITIGMTPYIDEMFEATIEEEVSAIETAVYKPDEYMHLIRKAKRKGIVWIHKAATVRHIKHAERLGADAVVIVGLDGYGFKNPQQFPTFTAVSWAAKQVKIPLIAAGGIGDAYTFLGALALGAEAVYMGTAFTATKESPMAETIKRNIASATPEHPDLIYELVAPPDLKEYMMLKQLKEKMPFEKWVVAMERLYLKLPWQEVDPMWEEAEILIKEREAETVPSYGSRPKGPYSFACGYIDDIPTVEELIQSIIKGAEEILKKWVVNFDILNDMRRDK